MTLCKSFKKSVGGAAVELANFFGLVNLVLSDLFGGVGFFGNAGGELSNGGSTKLIFLVFFGLVGGGSAKLTFLTGCGDPLVCNSDKYGGTAVAGLGREFPLCRSDERSAPVPLKALSGSVELCLYGGGFTYAGGPAMG